MRPLAYTRYKYSGQSYKSVLSTTGTTETVSFYFVGNVSLNIGMNKTGRMIATCDQPLPIASLIADIKDSNNNLILDQTVWQISSLQPVLNAFGNVEEYRMTLIKYQGTI